MSSPDVPARDERPSLKRPRRMDRLATLPLFFMLGGRRAVVVGGNEAAAWKAELLSAAGATVEVRDPDPCAEMEALAADPPGGAVDPRHGSRGRRSALPEPPSSIGAADDDAEAARIFDAARACGVPVNVIDRPAYCTFQFGAIVNRSPLVVGISTGGAAPVFGQAIRSRIEALLPIGFKRWAAAAKRWRGDLGKLDLRTAGAAALLGAVHRAGARRAGSPADCGGSRDAAGRSARRRSGPVAGGSRHAGRRGTGQSGAADAAGRARAALGRRHPVRRSGGARDPRFRPPRGQAHAGRQDRLRALVQAGRHQRADGGARQIRQARGAAEGRRPHDLRPRRRGDRRAASARGSRSRSCPASPLRRAPRRASRSR